MSTNIFINIYKRFYTDYFMRTFITVLTKCKELQQNDNTGRIQDSTWGRESRPEGMPEGPS